MTLQTVAADIDELSLRVGPRPVGSPANHQAAAYIAARMQAAGLEVEQQSFDCLDWSAGPVGLRLNGQPLPARLNWYSPACRAAGTYVALDSLAALQAADLNGRFAVLHGALSAEAYFPKNFPFFSIESQQAVIRQLEASNPLGVIAISRQQINPAPLFEDGDFALPSVTLSAAEGERLLAQPTARLELTIESQSRPSHGANVIGRRLAGNAPHWVVCAHYDTKPETPGALDNAAGVAALLELADRLAGQRLPFGLEFVAFNGEEHYLSPGEMAFIQSGGADPARVSLAINIDGIGWGGRAVTFALFDCPAAVEQAALNAAARIPNLKRADPWPQGDHSIFVYNRVPAIALTSDEVERLVETILHTPDDLPSIVDPATIVLGVDFICELFETLGST
jgi:aminopeptidase YwaD